MEQEDVEAAREKALSEHREAVETHETGNEPKENFDVDNARETVVEPTAPVPAGPANPVEFQAPERHDHSSYDAEAQNKSVEDADFDAEERDEKDGDS